MTRVHCVCVLALNAVVFGCGSGDHADIAPTDDQNAIAQFKPSVNLCPLFRGSLAIPVDIPLGGASTVTAIAIDPDGRTSALAYEWSAESGSFTDAELAVTEYRCAGLGRKALSVTATDANGCLAHLTVNVNCLDR